MGGRFLSLMALGLVTLLPVAKGQEPIVDDWLTDMVDNEMYSSDQSFQPASGGGSWKKFTTGMRWANRAWGEGKFTKDDISKAKVVNVDGLFTSTAEIKRLKGMGKLVMCYISGGSIESYRPDASQFRAVSGLVGNTLHGWNQERWLNIGPSKKTSLRKLMGARIKTLAKKGCDAVEVDNIDCYQNSACVQSWGYSRSNAYKYQLEYNKWLAEYAHSVGLAIGQKNNYDQIGALKNLYDFFVYEECAEWKICGLIKPFVQLKKAVFGTEYTGNRAKICAEANTLRYNTKYAGGPDGWYDCEDYRIAGSSIAASAPQTGWSEWSEWSDCSTSCDAGTQSRERNCLQGECIGVTKETMRCNLGACATIGDDPHADCMWGDWFCDVCDCETGSTQCSRSSLSAPGTCGPFTTKTARCQCDTTAPTGPAGPADVGSSAGSEVDTSLGESSDEFTAADLQAAGEAWADVGVEEFVFGNGMVMDNMDASASDPVVLGSGADLLEDGFVTDESVQVEDGEAVGDEFVFGDPITAEDEDAAAGSDDGVCTWGEWECDSCDCDAQERVCTQKQLHSADAGCDEEPPTMTEACTCPGTEEDDLDTCEWGEWSHWGACKCDGSTGHATRHRTSVDAAVCDGVTREEEARRCSCGKVVQTPDNGDGEVAGIASVPVDTEAASAGTSTATIVAASVGATGAVVALAGLITGAGILIRRRKMRKAAEERVPFWAQYADENEGLPDVSVEHM